jgi:hypothetical protein
MTLITAGVAAALLAATIDVPAGGDLAAAVASARPGDVVRLGRGVHDGALGRISGVRIEGAGAGATEVRAPEGEDAAVAVGSVELAGLTLRAGPTRCALKVFGGTARVSDAVLLGGAEGAFVEQGRLEGTDVDLAGTQYGLLSRGDVVLRGGSARGGHAGVAAVAGTLALSRFAVVGPSSEAGIAIAGARARLDAVTIRAPGPSGLSILRGEVDGRDVAIAGATEQKGILGDCVLALRATVRLASSTLDRCGGTALSVSRGEGRVAGVDASGGSAGCLVFVDGAEGDVQGNVCSGRGPALVAGSGAHVRTLMNAWRTDPTVWVDCGSGARVELLDGASGRQPCAPPP